MPSSNRTSLTVILTHEHTDFDALASMLAASRLYPHAVPVLPHQINRNLEAFLAIYRDMLPFVHLDDLPRRRVENLVLVDTQTVQPLRGMHPQATGDIIDHHPLMRDLPPGWTYSGEEVGATTTLLVEKLAEQGLAISPVEATLLALGIYEDTGSLSYETTTGRDLRSAAWLLERGANLLVVNKFLHHPLTDEQRQLYQQLADNSQPYQFHGHSVIIASATVHETVEEISTLAHKLQDLYEPDALFMLVDMGDRIQMVARSTDDAIDVGKIASALGGGGHGRASAALIRNGSLASAFEALVYLLQGHVRPTTTVGQIMSYGLPQTLAPDDTIGEAAERMRRYGFEGFPVVHGDRIVGMLTRREIDRAVHHGLEKHPVSRYMRAGEVFVTPDDSVATLRRVMTEHDWGQVPVLDAGTGKLVGIVTRTDLIKQWETSAQPQVERLDQMMERSLPVPLLDLLRQVGEVAQELSYPIYAVGGFVRDLLLSLPTSDVDLVVEGDAIDLARELTERFGGRVRSHRRFGTAKWILPDLLGAGTQAAIGAGTQAAIGAGTQAAIGAGTQAAIGAGTQAAIGAGTQAAIGAGTQALPLLPEALDFVTARTEFYEHPTALPRIERSSVKQDLHRRDFTINTLAVSLTPSHWGELLDFYGGRKDLDDGIIRVLHSLSFVEDPTRILRGARFEQRFSFRIEPRTEELIGDALDMLDRVSAERVRHELELIVAEEAPERVLCRLADLDVLPALHPALRCDAWLQTKAVELRAQLTRLRDAGNPLSPDAAPRLHMALFTLNLPPVTLAEFIDKFRVRKEYRDLMLEVAALSAHLGRLGENNLKPSEIVKILEDASDEACLLLRVVTDSWLVHRRLDLYQRRLRYVRPTLNGDDLRRMGIPPARVYHQILDRLRDAHLDGEISTRAEEEAIVRQWEPSREKR
jgi:tRNA nucleotidyltransferase (CCA-adding enzyme)